MADEPGADELDQNDPGLKEPDLKWISAAIKLGGQVNRFEFHLDQAVLIDDRIVADAPAEVRALRLSRLEHYQIAIELLASIISEFSATAVSEIEFVRAVQCVHDLIESNLHSEGFNCGVPTANDAWCSERRQQLLLGMDSEAINDLTQRRLNSLRSEWSLPARDLLTAAIDDNLPANLRGWYELGRTIDQALCPDDAWKFVASSWHRRVRNIGCLCKYRSLPPPPSRVKLPTLEQVLRASEQLVEDESSSQPEPEDEYLLSGYDPEDKEPAPDPLSVIECCCSLGDNRRDVATMWRGLAGQPPTNVYDRHGDDLRRIEAANFDDVLAFASRKPGDLLPQLFWERQLLARARAANCTALEEGGPLLDRLRQHEQDSVEWLSALNNVTEQLADFAVQEACPAVEHVSRLDSRQLTEEDSSSGRASSSDLQPIGVPSDLHKPQVPPQGSQSENVFRLEGEICSITFNGRNSDVDRKDGHTYICELLHKAGTPLDAMELYARKNQRSGRKVATAAEADELLKSISDQGGKGARADCHKIFELIERLKEGEKEAKRSLDAAMLKGDVEGAKKHHAEISAIKREVRRLSYEGDDDRTFKNTVDKVKRAINRTLAKLPDEVRTHITSGLDYRKGSWLYGLKEPREWVT